MYAHWLEESSLKIELFIWKRNRENQMDRPTDKRTYKNIKVAFL